MKKVQIRKQLEKIQKGEAPKCETCSDGLKCWRCDTVCHPEAQSQSLMREAMPVAKRVCDHWWIKQVLGSGEILCATCHITIPELIAQKEQEVRGEAIEEAIKIVEERKMKMPKKQAMFTIITMSEILKELKSLNKDTND